MVCDTLKMHPKGQVFKRKGFTGEGQKKVEEGGEKHSHAMATLTAVII